MTKRPARIGVPAGLSPLATQSLRRHQGARTMTSEQYRKAVEKLGYTAYSIAPVIGISKRQSFRLASGESAVLEPIARLLAMFKLHGIPEDWR